MGAPAHDCRGWRGLAPHPAGAGRCVLRHGPAHPSEAARRHPDRHPRSTSTSGHADLAIGVSVEGSNVAGLQQGLLGELLFIYVVAPHHPLASAPEPSLTPPCCSTARGGSGRLRAARRRHQRGPVRRPGRAHGGHHASQGAAAQLRGLGGGFLPEPMVRPYLEAGHLVARSVARPACSMRMHYAWGGPGFTAPGRALQWWLPVAKSGHAPRTAGNHHHF